jgi:hypothetical protein
MDFETATLLLEKLGVKYSQDYEYRGAPPRESVNIPLITSVNFQFTKIEWFEIASSDGTAYIGGCCGQTSAAQDLISKWFRFNPTSIPAEELEELAYIMKSHDDVEKINPDDPIHHITFAGLDRSAEDVVEICAPKWKQMWPLDRMALVWHIIKDVRKTKPVHTEKLKERSEVERAISTAHRTLQYFWFNSVLSNDEESSQVRSGDTMVMFHLIPSLKTIMDHMASEMYKGPFEGYALWNIADNHVAKNGYGPCIFYTKEECDELISVWEKNQDLYNETEKVNFRERLTIKRVRVSLENGLEVLE